MLRNSTISKLPALDYDLPSTQSATVGSFTPEARSGVGKHPELDPHGIVIAVEWLPYGNRRRRPVGGKTGVRVKPLRADLPHIVTSVRDFPTMQCASTPDDTLDVYLALKGARVNLGCSPVVCRACSHPSPPPLSSPHRVPSEARCKGGVGQAGGIVKEEALPLLQVDPPFHPIPFA